MHTLTNCIEDSKEQFFQKHQTRILNHSNLLVAEAIYPAPLLNEYIPLKKINVVKCLLIQHMNI